VFCVLVFCTAVWADDFPYVAKAIGGDVNVRAGQSVNFERLCQLDEGEEVLVIDKQFSWCKIQLPAKAKSYVHKQYIQSLSADTGGVMAEQVNIRAGPGIHFTVLGQLNKGEIVYLLEDVEDWYRISPAHGSYGWIVEDFLAFKSSDVSAYRAMLGGQPKMEKIPEVPARVAEPILNETMTGGTTPMVAMPMVEEEPAVLPQPLAVNSPPSAPVEEQVFADEAVNREKTAEPVKKLQKPALKMDIPENGILSFDGYVETYEPKGRDGIFYKIVLEGNPVCYVQGPNQMLGRFLHQKVTVKGPVVRELTYEYRIPVLTVSNIRLMI